MSHGPGDRQPCMRPTVIERNEDAPLLCSAVEKRPHFIRFVSETNTQSPVPASRRATIRHMWTSTYHVASLLYSNNVMSKAKYHKCYSSLVGLYDSRCKKKVPLKVADGMEINTPLSYDQSC